MNFLRTVVIVAGLYLWVVLFVQPENWTSAVPQVIQIGTAVLYFVAVAIAVLGYLVLAIGSIFFGHHVKKTLWIGVIASALSVALTLFVDADPNRPPLTFWVHITAIGVMSAIYFSLLGPVALGIAQLAHWAWKRRPGAKRLLISGEFA